MIERYLFRGKRKNNNEWIEGNLIQFNSSTLGEITEIVNEGISYEVIPETVGQCTGLRDKNGKLIFEGDLLDYILAKAERYIYKVFHSDAYAGWVMRWVLQRKDNHNVDCLGKWVEPDFEIVGNIYDNPELLQETE